MAVVIQYPALGILLALMPLALWLVWRHERERRRVIRAWLGAESTRVRWRWVAPATRLLAMLLIVAASVGPARDLPPAATGDTRVVFVIDVSMSMAADDVTPSRLRAVADHLIERLPGWSVDQVAVVALGADARVVCPLTSDRAAVREALTTLDVSSARAGSADPLVGIRFAQGLLRPAAVDRIVLVTDGERPDGSAVTVVDPPPGELRGAPVDVVGVGTERGGRVPLRDGAAGEWQRGADDAPFLSRRNEAPLQLIARLLGGRYSQLEQFDLDAQGIERFAATGGLLDKVAPFGPVQLYGWLLAMAGALLAAEFFLERRSV